MFVLPSAQLRCDLLDVIGVNVWSVIVLGYSCSLGLLPVVAEMDPRQMVGADDNTAGILAKPQAVSWTCERGRGFSLKEFY